MTALTATGLGFRRASRWVLRDVSLEIQPGIVLAVLGANGSGKSTLLRCLSGLWRQSEGDILLDGRPLQAFRRAALARRIAYVPQDVRLDFDFSVREVVLMGRYAHRGRFDRERASDRSAAEDAMQRADVAHLADRLVTQLSGGERQRVFIARSLATNAEILVLDEPTANLDVDHSLEVLELCRSLAREGRAVAIATHDLNAAYRFVDRVALLESGGLLAVNAPATVLTPANVEKAFRVRSHAVRGEDGTSMLVFHRLGDESAYRAAVRESHASRTLV